MYSVCKTLSFASTVIYDPALFCSDEFCIALCTQNGVHILELQCNSSQPEETIIFCRSKVNPSVPNLFDIGVDRRKILESLSPKETYCMTLDHSLCPSEPNPATARRTGFRLVRWSPGGASSLGRCILATLSMDNRLCLQMQKTNKFMWETVIELSEKFRQYAMSRQFEFVDRTRKCVSASVEGASDSFRQLILHTSVLAAQCIVWSSRYARTKVTADDVSPSVEKLADDDADTMCEDGTKDLSEDAAKSVRPAARHFAVLVAAMKSGHLVFWTVDFPLAEKGCRVDMVVTTDDEAPTAIEWCEVDDRSALVAVGYFCGRIRLFLVAREVGSDDLCVTPVTSAWCEDDRIAVHHFCWFKERRLLLASKGPLLVPMTLTLSGGDVKVKVHAPKVISNNFHINCITRFGSDVLLSIQPGEIFSAQITQAPEGEVELAVEPVVLEGSGGAQLCHGVSVSPSGVYLIVVRSPANDFCHLTISQPLQVTVYQKNSADLTKLMMNYEGGLAGRLDVLAALRHALLTDRRWPPHFSRLVSERHHWPQLTTGQLKLLRYLLGLMQQQLKSPAKSNPTPATDLDPIPDDCAECVVTVGHMILGRHVRAAVTSFLQCETSTGADHQLVRQSVAAMCRWLSLPEQADSDAAVDAAVDAALLGRLRARLWPDGADQSERSPPCAVCGEPVEISLRTASCKNSHTFASCCQTLLVCCKVPYRVCICCGVVAAQRQITGFSWFDELQCNECVLCDGTLA